MFYEYSRFNKHASNITQEATDLNSHCRWEHAVITSHQTSKMVGAGGRGRELEEGEQRKNSDSKKKNLTIVYKPRYTEQKAAYLRLSEYSDLFLFCWTRIRPLQFVKVNGLSFRVVQTQRGRDMAVHQTCSNFMWCGQLRKNSVRMRATWMKNESKSVIVYV